MEGQCEYCFVWVTITSTLGQSGYDQQLTVLAIEHAGGVGAVAMASVPSGAPSISLAATAVGSYSYAVGHDYDTATGRTVGSRQTLMSQWIDTATRDTSWTQGTTGKSTSVGQIVTLNDTSPTADQWNTAAISVLPWESTRE